MRKWIGTMFVVVIAVLAGCGGGGDGGGFGFGPGFGGSPGATAQKIIIDSDYNTMSDDGQLGVMAAQLQASGKVQVMGISVVSGNQWLKQGVADALMSVERLGVGEPHRRLRRAPTTRFNHTYADIQAEMAAGAGGDGYLGAWSGPEPKTDADLKPSPDGFATHTTLQRKSAVDFIVDTVKANPNEIVILAIGPLTNIALAVKQNPEIVPLIKKIIYMGGAVDVAGQHHQDGRVQLVVRPRCRAVRGAPADPAGGGAARRDRHRVPHQDHLRPHRAPGQADRRDGCVPEAQRLRLRRQERLREQPELHAEHLGHADAGLPDRPDLRHADGRALCRRGGQAGRRRQRPLHRLRLAARGPDACRR
jgi:hypothetical protein